VFEFTPKQKNSKKRWIDVLGLSAISHHHVRYRSRWSPVMTLSRRKMIGLVGGGVVLAATASAGGFLATRRPSRALSPWSAAGNYAEPRMNALSYAILAPNPHN
jgi:hypothetical protein